MKFNPLAVILIVAAIILIFMFTSCMALRQARLDIDTEHERIFLGLRSPVTVVENRVDFWHEFPTITLIVKDRRNDVWVFSGYTKITRAMVLCQPGDTLK